MWFIVLGFVNTVCWISFCTHVPRMLWGNRHLSDKLHMVLAVSDRFSAIVTLDTAGVSLPMAVLSVVLLWPTKLPAAQVNLVYLARLWWYFMNSSLSVASD